MKRKILITGGAGFIGSSLADRLIKDKDNFVVIVDDLSTGFIRNLPNRANSNWTFIKANVNKYSDISQIIVKYNFDYIFHYAAVVGVQRTLMHPSYVLEDIEGFKYIMQLAKNTAVKRVFFSSSSEVYGEPVEMPQREDTTPLNARLPYAVVKNLGEIFLKTFNQEHGLDYTIFRFFNTYGPKQNTDFVMSKFISAALDNKDITVYGDGSQSRTFCYIEDNLDATLNTLNNNKYINDVVNIGNDEQISIIDLAKIIIKITKSKSKIVHLPPLKEGDMTRRQPDITKMSNLIKGKFTPLEVGISKVIKEGVFNKF